MKETVRLPILPLRDPSLVVFPNAPAEIDVGREISLNAIKAVENGSGSIIIAMQKTEKSGEPKANDFHTICTEAQIKFSTKLDDNRKGKKIIVKGTNRVQLKVIGTHEGYLVGDVVIINEDEVSIDDKTRIYVNEIYDIISEFLTTDITIKARPIIKSSSELSEFADLIASQLSVTRSKKLKLLKESNPAKRIDLIHDMIIGLAELQEMGAEPDNNISIQQDDSGDVNRLKKLIKKSGMPDKVLKIANKEISRLSGMSPTMSEFSIVVNYIETLASIPWDKKTEDKIDIEEAKKVLDEDHYGLEKFKERILEYLAVKKLNKSKKGAILCFHGSSGCGKTSSAQSIARAMGRKFVRMSLGGIHDEAEIRGHRRTYVGAMMGRIIQGIVRSSVKNPLFLLDEVDKLTRDYRGDPASALLEVLDPEQNDSFTDNYLNVPFDLSDVLFICTANDVSTIPLALKDRLEIIDIQGYSPHDKLKIAQKHLIKKQMDANGLKDYNISISPNAINKIIEEYTCEAGVRSLERTCGAVFRKISIMVASGKEPPSIVRSDSLYKFLGPPKIFSEKAVDAPEVGLCAGLSWSTNGGSLLFVEASMTHGKGETKTTGNLGKVLEESIRASYTWVKSNYEFLDVDLKEMEKSDIHIHFPSGAISKDGPSAGIAITTSIVSVLTKRPIPNDIAMTGEISLRGRVLPIGGLEEKVMAAHRAGIKRVLYPEQNNCHIGDIPEDVRDNIELIPVSNLKDALKNIFGINNG